MHLLRAVHPAQVYLVGDIFDGWALSRRWRWEPAFTTFLLKIMDWARQGVDVCYAPGNHDEFLRSFLVDFGFVQVANEFRYRSAAGESFLVVHGDAFDDEVSLPRWKRAIGSAGYDFLIECDGLINVVRERLGMARVPLALGWRRLFSSADRFVELWSKVSVEHARSKGFQGIICGHVHTPRIGTIDGVAYLNIGDWVENCAALIEDNQGGFRHVSVDSSMRLSWSQPMFGTPSEEALSHACA